MPSMWDLMASAFVDEMEKISEISLAGLSPETVMSASSPPPMETVGYQKARDTLHRAEAMKTASSPSLQQPGFDRVWAKNKDDSTAVQQAKGLGAYTLGGAGAGRLVGEFSAGRTLPKTLGHAAEQAAHSRKWYGTAIGAGLGGAEFARRRLAARKASQQKTAMISPKMQLRASQQVAKGGNAMRATSSVAERVRGSQIHP